MSLNPIGEVEARDAPSKRTEFNRRLIGVFVAFDVWVMLVKLELLPAVITF